jgi:hypothetical protein
MINERSVQHKNLNERSCTADEIFVAKSLVGFGTNE